MNKVIHDEDARLLILEGAKVVYEAVKTTMGPKGRNVVIGNGYGAPTVTHDGVTVAKGIELEGDLKVGADMLRQVAIDMNSLGDGTTTVTVLTYHILNEANKLIAAGHNPMLLRRQIEKAAEAVLTGITAVSEPVHSLNQVATIAGGDKEIGNLVARVIQTVGGNGVVTVEAGQGLAMESEIAEGFTFPRGYVSPYMVTNQVRMEAVYDNPYILVTDQKIDNLNELLPLLEEVSRTKRPLVIICDDAEGEALATLILNKLKGVLNAVVIKAPSYGNERRDILEDIAILTGGKTVSVAMGLDLASCKLEHLGTARKVIVGKDETTIIGGKGNVEKRIESLLGQKGNDYEKDRLAIRAAALQGKVAVIKVGGATETEIEEKKFRVDDAVAAVKAALSEGIVPGGGTTLALLARDVSEPILHSALSQPFRVLMENAGLPGDYWLPQLKDGYGVDVQSGRLVDFKKTGIMDPAKITKEALRTAVSTAGVMMTIGAAVIELPKEKDDI